MFICPVTYPRVGQARGNSKRPGRSAGPRLRSPVAPASGRGRWAPYVYCLFYFISLLVGETKAPSTHYRYQAFHWLIVQLA